MKSHIVHFMFSEGPISDEEARIREDIARRVIDRIGDATLIRKSPNSITQFVHIVDDETKSSAVFLQCRLKDWHHELQNCLYQFRHYVVEALGWLDRERLAGTNDPLNIYRVQFEHAFCAALALGDATSERLLQITNVRLGLEFEEDQVGRDRFFKALKERETELARNITKVLDDEKIEAKCFVSHRNRFSHIRRTTTIPSCRFLYEPNVNDVDPSTGEEREVSVIHIGTPTADATPEELERVLVEGWSAILNAAQRITTLVDDSFPSTAEVIED